MALCVGLFLEELELEVTSLMCGLALALRETISLKILSLWKS